MENMGINCRKQNNILNFLKGIGCICVVFIHVKFPGNFGEIVKQLSSWVVPMFFMISGFYTYDRDRNKVKNKIPKRIKHISIVTLYAIGVYAFYTITSVYIGNNKITITQWIAKSFNFKSLYGILLLNNLDFIKAGHLWFLPALIYCYIILYLFNKFDLYKTAYHFLPILFLIQVIITGLPFYNWHFTGNFLVYGLPYVIMGNYIAYNKERVLRIKTNILKGVFILGAMIAVIGVFFVFTINYRYIGSMLMSLSIFIWAEKFPCLRSNSKIAQFGSKYSLYVYIMHIFIAGCVNIIVEILFLRFIQSNIYLWFYPIIVVCLTILSGYVFFYLRSIIKKIFKITQDC